MIMKPIIILPPGSLSDSNIQLLRDNELCVVVAKDPAAVKFVDPIPAISSRTRIKGTALDRHGTIEEQKQHFATKKLKQKAQTK